MNRRMFGTLAMAVSALLVSASALAHHGRGLIYDANKETTVKGAITEYVWSNPHVQISIQGVDAKGARGQWLLEASSTGVLSQRGWTRKSLKPGDMVTITFHPGLKGSPTGDLLKVVFADGKELPR